MTWSWVEALGYLSSVLILLSLMMRSIVKLRIINLLGALGFTIYGLITSVWPVTVMNFSVVLVNIYYLIRMRHESFALISIKDLDSDFMRYFIKRNKTDLNKYRIPEHWDMHDHLFYILRNGDTAGIIVFNDADKQHIDIKFDYVVSKYRDTKIGHFIFHANKAFFVERAWLKLQARSYNRMQRKYLKKVGFREFETDKFEMEIRA